MCALNFDQQSINSLFPTARFQIGELMEAARSRDVFCASLRTTERARFTRATSPSRSFAISATGVASWQWTTSVPIGRRSMRLSKPIVANLRCTHPRRRLAVLRRWELSKPSSSSISAACCHGMESIFMCLRKPRRLVGRSGTACSVIRIASRSRSIDLFRRKRQKRERARSVSGDILRAGQTTDQSPHTANVIAIDGEGNLISLTATQGWMYGSHLVVDGLGLVLNHGMSRFDYSPGHPNSPAPGKRMQHNMAPMIALRDGRTRVRVWFAGRTENCERYGTTGSQHNCVRRVAGRGDLRSADPFGRRRTVARFAGYAGQTSSLS